MHLATSIVSWFLVFYQIVNGLEALRFQAKLDGVDSKEPEILRLLQEDTTFTDEEEQRSLPVELHVEDEEDEEKQLLVEQDEVKVKEEDEIASLTEEERLLEVEEEEKKRLAAEERLKAEEEEEQRLEEEENERLAEEERLKEEEKRLEEEKERLAEKERLKAEVERLAEEARLQAEEDERERLRLNGTVEVNKEKYVQKELNDVLGEEEGGSVISTLIYLCVASALAVLTAKACAIGYRRYNSYQDDEKSNALPAAEDSSYCVQDVENKVASYPFTVMVDPQPSAGEVLRDSEWSSEMFRAMCQPRPSTEILRDSENSSYDDLASPATDENPDIFEEEFDTRTSAEILRGSDYTSYSATPPSDIDMLETRLSINSLQDSECSL